LLDVDAGGDPAEGKKDGDAEQPPDFKFHMLFLLITE
jgi:hypothetical protein